MRSLENAMTAGDSEELGCIPFAERRLPGRQILQLGR
jgi:hypothetical protein